MVETEDLKTDTCECPVGEEPDVGDGPTAEDFSSSLIEQIKVLEDEGEIKSVQSLATNILEGQPVNCDGEQRPFSSFVLADLGVDPKVRHLSSKSLCSSSLSPFGIQSLRPCDCWDPTRVCLGPSVPVAKTPRLFPDGQLTIGLQLFLLYQKCNFDAKALEPAKIVQLETIFKDSYNALTWKSCGEFYYFYTRKHATQVSRICAWTEY